MGKVKMCEEIGVAYIDNIYFVCLNILYYVKYM